MFAKKDTRERSNFKGILSLIIYSAKMVSSDYTVPGIKTSNHVEESVKVPKEKLEDITERYTRFDILRKRNGNLKNAVYGIDYKNAFTLFKESDPVKISKYIEYISNNNYKSTHL